jgi:hypothetical protein
VRATNLFLVIFYPFSYSGLIIGCLVFLQCVVAKNRYTQQQPMGFAGASVLWSAFGLGCWLVVEISLSKPDPLIY